MKVSHLWVNKKYGILDGVFYMKLFFSYTFGVIKLFRLNISQRSQITKAHCLIYSSIFLPYTGFILQVHGAHYNYNTKSNFNARQSMSKQLIRLPYRNTCLIDFPFQYLSHTTYSH